MSFEGNGFVELSAKAIGSVKVNEGLIIMVEFTATGEDGLLLWQGDRAKGEGHYIALAGT